MVNQRIPSAAEDFLGELYLGTAAQAVEGQKQGEHALDWDDLIDGDGEESLPTLSAATNASLQGLRLEQQFASLLEQHLACGREDGAMSTAVKERDSERFFEFADGVCHRGGHPMQRLGGAGKAAVAIDGVEGGEGIQVNSHSKIMNENKKTFQFDDEDVSSRMQPDRKRRIHMETLIEPQLRLLPGADRGHAHRGWLDSWHSFSFADYYNPKAMQFRVLRVINEDRIAGGAGFPPHSHQDMEIITYVMSGALRHRDSTGGHEVLRPGELQVMTAGRGITHSEMNASSTDSVHLLQIWITPNLRGLAPGYQQQALPENALRRGWTRVVAPEGEAAPFVIHQDARLWIGWPAAGQIWDQPLDPARHYYLQVAQGRVEISGRSLTGGDALTLQQADALRLQATQDAELLLFDLP